jgi:hypothetical protein
MIIHVIGSMRYFEEDRHFMQVILQSLEKNHAKVAQDWISSASGRRARNGTTTEAGLNWPEIVETNIRVIGKADALIIEGSRFNYSQGFQTAVALEHNKPVLNLYREDLPEYKEWPDKLFVSGVSHPLFTSKAYKNEEELEKIVTEFMRQYSKKTKELDLQLALSADDYDKIDQLSHEQGKSKTSIIKDLILENLHDK